MHEKSKQLASDIQIFLYMYGRKDAEEPEYWNSPDAVCLEEASNNLLKTGKVKHLPRSSWESGGYYPYNSAVGKNAHNKLLERIEEFLV